MAQPYIGEIRMFGGNFAPVGWAFCEGQILAIAENDTLFTLIGTTYGGDGQATFALPDLRGRIPIHMGNGHVLAEQGGSETVTLTVQQLPVHNHLLVASTTAASSTSPSGKIPATSTSSNLYAAGPTTVQLGSAISGGGGSQPHENVMPFLCVSFIISLFGIFPAQF